MIAKYRNFSIEEQDLWNYFLKLNLRDNNDFKLFSELILRRLPFINTISLGFIDKEMLNEVKNFLEKSFPRRLNCLELNLSKRPKDISDLLDLFDFVNILVNISSLITNELRIYNCNISAKDMNKLLTYFSHCKKLSFCWSKFDLNDSKEQLDFSMVREPKLEKINFEGCGDPILNDWRNKPEDLVKILKAFKKSHLKNTIRKFNFDECNLEDDQVSEILKIINANIFY